MFWTNQLDEPQKKCLKFIVSRDGSLIISETGTGKTLISLAAIENWKPRLTLIIAPLTSLDIVWAPRIAQLAGFRLYRSFDDWRSLDANPASQVIVGDVLLLHYQAAAKLYKQLGRIKWNCVIIDEAQGLKARNSGWSRMARKLRKAGRRIALTATPMDESPIDFFGIMRFVDHEVLGEHFGPFADEFCDRAGYMGYQWKFDSRLLPRLLTRLKPYVYRLTKDYLGLKPLQVHLVPTDLLGDQRRVYDCMDRDGVVSGVIAPREVTKQVKLEQITGGVVLDDERREVYCGSAKRRKLAVLMPRVKLPVVVFCKYLHEIPIISALFDHEPYKVAVLRGKVRGEVRTKLINDFQAGKIDVLICQVRTGGVSIEFTRSSSLIFYSMNFSLIDFEQIIGRFHRRGQTEEVHVYIIYARNTVDETIITTIKKKHSGFYVVVSHFEELRKWQTNLSASTKQPNISRSLPPISG